MKRFLLLILQFAMATLLTAIILQFIISYKIKNITLTGIDNLEQTSGINADLVFLGSSRCRAHFDPAFFDSSLKIKSVNIGVDGHSELLMTIMRLQNYLKRNTPPAYAIVNMDPLVSTGYEKANYVHKDQFARYAFLPQKNDLPIVNYFGFNIAEKYAPMYALLKYKLTGDCFFQKFNSWSKYGYDRHDIYWDTISTPVQNELKKFYFTKDQFTPVYHILDSLKQICNSNKIKLIAVQTPLYKILCDDDRFLMVKQLCESLRIPFYDMNLPEISNDIHNFYNSDHLNINGVNAMNRKLFSDALFLKEFSSYKASQN